MPSPSLPLHHHHHCLTPQPSPFFVSFVIHIFSKSSSFITFLQCLFLHHVFFSLLQVFVALLGVAAARPQFLYPASPQVITYKAAEGDQARVITTPFIYPYPTTYSTHPFNYASLPYTHPFVYPVVANPVVANPAVTQRERRTIATKDTSAGHSGLRSSGTGTGSFGSGSTGSLRSKRSADAEPELKPEPPTVYTGIPFTGTTAYHYPTYPLVSTYGAFPNVPLSYIRLPLPLFGH